MEMNWRCRILKYLYKYKRKFKLHSLLEVQQERPLSTEIVISSDSKLNNLKILFFGTDAFSLPSLVALDKHKSNVNNSLGAVTSFKSPANQVRLYAEHKQLQLHRWPVTPDVCRQYDLGVVVSFGHLIPENIIAAFPYGMINVHASLLPRWRGAAPIIYAIMHGDRSTGVSIMKIKPKHFDIGDILAQHDVPIKEHVFMPELHSQLSQVGSQLLIKVLTDWPNSFVNARKQSNEGVTYAPKISTTIIDVVWSDLDAQQVHNRFRALYTYKNLTTNFGGRSVQLMDIKLPVAQSQNAAKSLAPGHFVYQRDRKCLLVGCAADTHIEVHSLRLEGKKFMSAMDFNNGFLKKLKISEQFFSHTNTTA